MFRWIIFPVMIVCQDIDPIFLIALLVVSFSRPRTSHAGVLKMPRVSDEYGVLEVKCKRKLFWDLFLITSVHSNTRQLALKVWHLTKFRSGWSNRVILEIELKYDFFRKIWLKAHYYPAYYIMADWPDWTVPSKNEFFIPSVLCCCYFYNLLWKGSECFDRPEYWMSGICLVKKKCRIYE